MIDTIAINNYYPSSFLKRNQVDTWLKLYRSELETLVLNPAADSYLPRLTIVKSLDGIVHLKAEVSVPKMLFGNNIRLPSKSEIFQGLKQIGIYATQKSGMPFNLERAVVNRVDFTKDYMVKDYEVIPIIKFLSQKIIPRCNRIFFNDSTLYFRSKGKTKEIKIYSKFHETIHRVPKRKDLQDLARGKLEAVS